MRRAKPKTKREIKHNEKREVQAHKKPAQEETNSIFKAIMSCDYTVALSHLNKLLTL
ncbi:hypothetical protein SAMN02983009_01975 [Fusobacterium necrophorum]|uniref:Uncharacterized protein n=1 Tax=Fusobacterium necrophorum BL TaxID=1441732 RepID=A0AB73BX08_9FUSO|nr:hypothetical protein [Fusobacterium necrophorum]KDE63813.1 hypothetical protein FUSO3_04470 [Fusobacterium necrophorum BL]KDE74608.1 hypothetical protein FUSO7_01945 [Fusobacterium necrophorum BFTR-2]SDB41203.1 hypothetical protein SAMN02983009_01975 [Fusobacterium necrophorum]SQC97407.1 Uncharacterised protein [Fusobacterium necrophorum subsp. necrophorum]SQD09497.1 Uncharacterised protein [Fusobacterium necrophorum subsp. necrophorum]